MKFVIISSLLFAVIANAGTEIKLATQTLYASEVGLSALEQSEAISQNEWIIQFKNHVTEKDKKQLTRNGLRILSYIPDDALIVKGTKSQLQKSQTANVQAVVAFAPAMKMSPDLGTLSVATSQVMQTFILSLFESKDLNPVLNQLKSMKVRVLTAAGTSVLVSANRSELLSLAKLTGVDHIQPYQTIESLHFRVSPSDLNESKKSAAGDYSDIDGTETGTLAMNFESVWKQNYSGVNQVVGMADTGLDSGDASAIHGDFNGAVKSGYAVGLFGKTWADPMGHGTHVAGSVLGRGAISSGKLKGAAYSASMVAQGMWSPILNNLSVPADLGKMFTQAYDDGARVHTNSWGAAANFGSYEKMAATVDQVMFEKQDLLVIFAAGNSGVDKNKDGRIDPNSVGTPGTAKNALTVGASENVTTAGGIQKKVGELASAKDNWPVAPITLSGLSDNLNGIAMFSSRGPTNDGRIKPDVVAPGTNILSVKSQQPTAEKLWGEYNSNYVWSGGTSMAAPLVAGAAAVARQIVIEKVTQNPSAAFLKAYLMQTATEMFPGQYGQSGASQGQEMLTLRPNNDEGYGRVNLAQIADTAAIIFWQDSRKGLATGEVMTSTVVIPKAGRLVANLVWTDAAGSPNAAKALVNDLDLKIVLADGRTLDSNDQINNHAFAQADVSSGLKATVTVSGINIPMGVNGKQPYALILSIQ